MPRRISTTENNPGRRSAAGRRLGAVLITAGLIATTACTQNSEPEPVSNPVKLLQNVHVGLSPAAGVETIEGTTISVAADGASSAEDTTYDAAQVVGELPVRVSLQYRAGEKSGSDLTELQGHTGPVEINLTVENLTVKPQVIEYDAAGQTRSDTALVGAPLTIAASTTLAGVRADDVTPGSADGATGTNGVLSSTENGETVVQWATVLAPPRSGASTTLRLVADVKDFQAPSFDMAVQPGLNTDMSADGVVAGAFSSGSGSEMELQQRTIALVSDVNTVLIKAGSTITEVRQNLQESSQTLGVKTAEELRDNSEALASTMSALKEQLTALGADLEGATNATQSTTMSQLQQTVSAVDSMLGDTSAVPRTASITDEGCEAVVAKPEQGASTVYSSILTMASQLDAYAKVSADCRDFVAGDIMTTIGPELPTPEACAAEAAKAKDEEEEGRISMTCAVNASGEAVKNVLKDLDVAGIGLVAGLQPQKGKVAEAIAYQGKTTEALTDVHGELASILNGPEPREDGVPVPPNMVDAIASAKASIAKADAALDGLQTQLGTIRETARGARAQLGDPLEGGTFTDGSMRAQNLTLANELCAVEDAEHLRAYLTASPCDPQNEEGGPAEMLVAPGGFPVPLDKRLEDQAAGWDSVLAAVDAMESAIDHATPVGPDLPASLRWEIANINANLEILSGAKEEIEVLNTAVQGAITSSAQIGQALADLVEQQADLETNIDASLAEVKAQADADVLEAVNDGARNVTEIGNKSSKSVITAFNNSISGLEATSDEVVGDAKGTVDKQRGELNERSGALAGALAESTQSSLERIASNTSGSTRDIEGANALLSSSLNKVMLDLGDRSVNGSGLLGSMATNAAKADTADYQLALAAQNAEGYGNIRSRDVAGLLLRQAQFKASLTAIDELPAFHLKVPKGATSQTLYSLTIGGGE